jgi:hypothetical protein
MEKEKIKTHRRKDGSKFYTQKDGKACWIWEGKIKPVGSIKLSKQGKAHIPQLIQKETNTQPGKEIPFVINASTVLLFDPDLNLEELLASIDVLREDVKLRQIKGDSKSDG